MPALLAATRSAARLPATCLYALQLEFNVTRSDAGSLPLVAPATPVGRLSPLMALDWPGTWQAPRISAASRPRNGRRTRRPRRERGRETGAASAGEPVEVGTRAWVRGVVGRTALPRGRQQSVPYEFGHPEHALRPFSRCNGS